MGSMNFALYPMVARYKSWKHGWEEPYLLGTNETIFRNTFADIEKISKLMGEGHGTKFEHECYDVGHLYNLAHGVDKGWFKPPIFLQLIFGILGGIGADMENLLFMKRTADKLFGDDYQWSVLGAGRSQMPFATQAVMMGGNVRVGLEDSLYIGRGKLAKNNAEQVAKIAAGRRVRLQIVTKEARDARPQGPRPHEVLKWTDQSSPGHPPREAVGTVGNKRAGVGCSRVKRSAPPPPTSAARAPRGTTWPNEGRKMARDDRRHLPIFPDKFFQEMTASRRLDNIGRGCAA
jgi:hypothetical protein